jgi:hypothetical protein
MREDLHYWMYYPFNFGKGPFGPVGWLGHRMLVLFHVVLGLTIRCV